MLDSSDGGRTLMAWQSDAVSSTVGAIPRAEGGTRNAAAENIHAGLDR